MTTYISKIFFLGLLLCSILSCKTTKKQAAISSLSENLVVQNPWFIAGPTVENERTINTLRRTDTLIRVTVNSAPKGELELNVMITSCGTNDGPATNLPASSTFVEISYKSSQLIKLQAREGNEDGIGCIHGGAHPTVDLPPSPLAFTTLKIPWANFKLSSLAGEHLLNTRKLCKFNFVNYNPVAGAILEIQSVKIEHRSEK